MRIAAVLFVFLSLAACNRGLKSNDAVRQAVIDHLSKVGLNISGMDVSVTSTQFNGNQADATVAIAPKGGNPAAGMSMKYHLEQRDNRWVVTGRNDGGSSPHGGAAMPQTANPHGGGMTAPGAENPHGGAGVPGKMPSPEDLPPASKKQ